jgi:hypothetical protein
MPRILAITAASGSMATDQLIANLFFPASIDACVAGTGFRVKKHDFGGCQVRGTRGWCGFAAPPISPAATTATHNHIARAAWLRCRPDFTP